MKILLITQFLSTTKGGGEYLFSLMANQLAKNGHKIWIITHKIENEDYTNFHKNVRIHFMSPIKYEGGLPPSIKENISFILSAFWTGLKLVKKEKIDLIHSNNFSPAFSASLISSFTQCPHITAMWDIFSLCGKNFWSKWAKQKNVSKFHAFVGKRFEKMILKLNHKAIHTISEATKDDLLKFGAKKPIHIILPAIETLEIEKNELNVLQFVYIGRLVFYKNLETIIRAIAIVKNSHPDVRLVVIGGGPHQGFLENLSKQLDLEKNVIFRGFIPENEKYRILSSSLATLFPSLCEGFGLVILESFMFEKPVFVSDVRPLSDILSDKIDGFVLKSTDEKIWAENMINLINNPELAKRMGKAGKEKLLQNYSLDSMIVKIESMYHEMIKTS